MKLGEALQRRSDALKRASELTARVQRSALIQDGDAPAERPETLIAELLSLTESVLSLIQRINRTNLMARLEGGTSVADAIAERDHLDRLRAHLLTIADAGTVPQIRGMRSEIKTVRTFDVGAIRRQADDLAKRRRELDVRIQQANWEHDLVE